VEIKRRDERLQDGEMLAEHLRAELGEFLRRRREELSPEDVGLPATGRRRTPGLRREEVAELAGISTALYAWLEQGRPVPVSKHTLDAVASALCLSADEREHLHNLGRPELQELNEEISPVLRHMVSSLSAHPVYVLNHAWDIVLENEAAVAVFGGPETTVRPDNLLRRVLTGERRKSMLVDWDGAAEGMIERFRFDAAAHPADQRITALVDELRAASTLFAEVWDRHRVRRYVQDAFTMRHPDHGELVWQPSSYVVVDSPGLRLLVFTPCDEKTTRSVQAKICLLPARPFGDRLQQTAAGMIPAAARCFGEAASS